MKEKMAALLEKMGASDVMVLSALGFTEARKGYAECAPKGDTGYHLYPDLDYIELVDPESGEPVAEGEDGELVYTCLEGQGTCLIRFRTGDFVKGGITNEPCPSCGRTVPRLSSDMCRSESVKGLSLTKIKGTLVDQGAFFAVLDGHPGVEEWQVEIRKPGSDPFEVDELSVFIAAGKGADEGELRDAISSELAAATEVNPNSVEFVSKDEMLSRLRAGTGMKELRVVDKRPSC
jgi:phenylacetate-coenzyme A ligase PaaK-like adenylate-forming protein